MATKTFLVSVREVHVQQFRVEAETENEALIKVSSGDGECLDNALEYSHSLDTDTWTVEEES
jgi:hypothetical protein